MIEVLMLHHIAINVTDLERSKEFYETILGLKEIESPNFPFRVAWYDLGEGRQLHLMLVPDSSTLRGTTNVIPNHGHFALRVKSYSEALETVKQAGVPHVATPDSPAPWPQLHISDPDGNIIEINAERLD